jgi:hypothetical protein
VSAVRFYLEDRGSRVFSSSADMAVQCFTWSAINYSTFDRGSNWE